MLNSANRRRFPKPLEFVNCPACGAVNPRDGAACQACAASLTIYIGAATHLPTRVGIGSLMILVASIAVGLGVARVVPALGAVELATVPIALLRTMAIVSQRRVDGRPMANGEHVSIFASSLGIVIVLFMSWVVTAALTGAVVLGATYRGVASPNREIFACGLAAIVGTLCAARIAWRIWPER